MGFLNNYEWYRRWRGGMWRKGWDSNWRKSQYESAPFSMRSFDDWVVYVHYTGHGAKPRMRIRAGM